MTLGLLDLPPEVLDEIVAHFEYAQNLTSLSSSCSKLKSYVERHGYRAFVRARFPSYDLLPQYKNATKSLTGLTRCWERRSLLTKVVDVDGALEVVRLRSNDENGNRPTTTGATQSMGCRTVLQCKEIWTGGDWRSRKESLFIGAGSELRLRERYMGPKTEQSYMEASYKNRAKRYNNFRQRVKWTIVRDLDHREGPCDIASVHSLPYEETGDTQTVILTRACGDIERVEWIGKSVTKRLLHHGSDGIKFADISPSKAPLIAASKSPHGISLIASSTPDGPSDALDQLDFGCEAGATNSLLWSCRFLDSQSLIVGRESKLHPLAVYRLAPDRLVREPLWKFSARKDLTCAKTIAPLTLTSSFEDNSSTLFLTGWRSNAILLHDTRSPNNSVSSYFDPVDQSAHAYSLLPFGVQKFIAGSDRHGLVKFFDLRMSGSRCYSTVNVGGPDRHERRQSTQPRDIVPGLGRGSSKGGRRGFNLFVQDTQSHSWGMIRHGANGRRARQHLRLRDSPIYHLAASSPYASSFYAGVVGATLQVDLVSSTDQWADDVFPTFSTNRTNNESNSTTAKTWLDPAGKALQLGLVEHCEPIELFTQASLEEATNNSSRSIKGLDSRWRSVAGTAT